jgi:hypothetical protein
VTSTTNPLGRIRLHDPRSRGFAYLATAPTVGYSVRHAMYAQNRDQFYSSGCVGGAGTNGLNCAMAVRSRRVYNKLFPDPHRTWDDRYLDNNDLLNNYSNSTKHDPFDWTYPPDDEGSSALGLMKFWRLNGIITGYDWTFSFTHFLAALQKQPVLVGTNWYDQMNYPSAQGIATVGGDSQGGHEYLANAILWHDRLIGFENSWGENWGLRGRFYLSFDDAEALIADGGDVAVPRLL